ncbi:MAG TPA: hypothetical protein VGI86_22535 [Acidimicrobiia bacterium]|jgi:uncharacterized membrane protein
MPSTPSGAPSAGPALSYGWSKFQQTAGVFIGIFVVAFIAQIVIDLIGRATGSIVGLVLLSIIGFVASVVAQYGVFNAALMVTRGETPTIGTAFQNDRWGPWVGFAIVYGICVGVGLILCGVGVILTAGLFGLAPFYFIDGRKGIGESISASLKATTSNGSVLGALLLCQLVAYAGVIACFVGLLVTIPLATLAVAWIYRGLIGSPVAA